MSEERIKVGGGRCGMTVSWRGSVSISRGHICVIAEMSDADKEALSRDPEGWRKEMERLKIVARNLMKEALRNQGGK